MTTKAAQTGRERTFDASERLISTTTEGGRITHANQLFANIAGYELSELEGQPHNIVRHPDMPKAAFKDLWDTLKQNHPWMGIVKNRCKNGDHYWVNAYVTPIYENGKVVGYQSVRVKPEPVVRSRAEQIYSCLQAGRGLPWHLGLGKPKLGMTGRLVLGYLLCLLPVFGGFFIAGEGALLWPLLGVGLGTGMAVVLALLFSQPYRKAAEKTHSIINNPIARRVYTGRQDELGQLELAIAALQSETRTILTRAGESAEQVNDVATEASAVVEQTDRAVQTQRQELEKVSCAMQEMSTTVEEVARNTANTAEAAQQADDQVAAGRTVVDDTVVRIEGLANQVKQASMVISRLREDSDAIGSVIDVIRGIADQTNLLALNAAIEAARAGEQGRGFAVVADEVRALASQTQASTEKIQQIIGSLQVSTAEAVTTMDAGQEQAQACVSQALSAGEALETIREAVVTIKDMSLQIATASEEQSAVAEEINGNVTSISTLANETAEASQHTARSTENLLDLVHGLHTLVNQFER